MRVDVYLLLIVKRYKRYLNRVQTTWQSQHEVQQIKNMYFLYLLLKRNELSERTVWVRPIFREERRLLQGQSDNLIVEMINEDEEKYFDFCRMDVQTFNELLDLVRSSITKQDAIRRPIPAKTRLEICLRDLASGDSPDSLSYAFRVSANTICKIIPETCQAIWDVLADIVFPKPTEELWREKAEAFERIANFPNCIGSIDGKHVTVQAPPRSGSTYFNYKGQHSIVLMAIVDVNGLFTIVDIGAEGRRSDGGIFMDSEVGRAFNNQELNLPSPRPLEESRPCLPYILVGDEAFALTDYMMRPYPRRTKMDLAKKVFNYRLSRARRAVECSFGILSSQWRVYRKPILASVENATKIIQATVCLHNFLLHKDLTVSGDRRQYSSPTEKGNETLNYLQAFLPNRRDPPRFSGNPNATQIREEFKNYFFTTGAVDFQWEKAINNNF